MFEGLAIEKLETEWKEYPVFHLDLNAEKYDSKEALEHVLSRNLSLWKIDGERMRQKIQLLPVLQEYLGRTYEQTGKQAVVLIDEYDKPLLQAILDEPLLEEYRRTLKAFFGVLKSATGIFVLYS